MAEAGAAARVSIGFKTSPQGVDWPTLDATWARAGELEVFDSGWMNDHITDPTLDRGGSSWEALTALTALVHHVPGLTVGHGVLSNTFRHPVILAKAATALDHATGGRFVLGLGAGWHEGEHLPFGIPLPPIRERFDRFESAVHTIRALFSDAAAAESGVSRADPFYPLDGATNLPPPLTPGGPPMWLGGQKRRGLALVARHGDGWMLPALPDFDIDYFSEKRDRILAEMSAAGTRPGRLCVRGPDRDRDDVREPPRLRRRRPFVRPRRRDAPDPRDAGPARARWSDRDRPRGGRAAPRGPRVSETQEPKGPDDAHARRRRAAGGPAARSRGLRFRAERPGPRPWPRRSLHRRWPRSGPRYRQA